jgi:hypothetical protein
VKQLLGGRLPSRVRGPEARRVVEAIAFAGIDLPRARYGQALGYCGRCNRHLTDEVSRAEGIGPECRRILGVREAA